MIGLNDPGYKAFLRIVPIAKQSMKMRAMMKDGKPFAMSYQPKSVIDYTNALKQLIALSKIPAEPFDGPLEMEAVFIFPWLKGHSKKDKAKSWMWKHTKPDCDNLCKPLLDSLEGLVFVNDSRVSITKLSKIYADNAGISVKIKQLNVRKLFVPDKNAPGSPEDVERIRKTFIPESGAF